MFNIDRIAEDCTKELNEKGLIRPQTQGVVCKLLFENLNKAWQQHVDSVLLDLEQKTAVQKAAEKGFEGT